MCGPGSSCLELLDNQVDEFRPTNTPGPLSIAFFFLGFILINQSIRRLFPSRAEDRNNNNGLPREPKSDELDAKEEEDEDEQDGAASKDLMRMTLARNEHPSSQHPQITHNRFVASESPARSLLPDPLSISSPLMAPNSIGLPNTWVDSHRNIIQPIHSSDFTSQAAQHFAEITDSCSESTTSA
ncbi:hypothetical protein PTTG_25888 [Puccinia triticina 1-1 BBBD Race 1]|uniref:Uncharacterized protein n=2 Tax=Puccinia triticina TaxID=208348 RepID=A0A0C4EQW0_PUCT1|nr:uncharacterized protein PtA15_15A453 [Puccinia triticina]OAV97947.1 hypothetical protein PTTG_25888 [Puccinia triticina 1-1 BBBD Race 1]WAQ92057.1 hypothetical protein PtA15_15A453 [Puccinia triticina]WAR62872.1 hypothetical protein PtB15_15B460 [Puccinia triticina]